MAFFAGAPVQRPPQRLPDVFFDTLKAAWTKTACIIITNFCGYRGTLYHGVRGARSSIYNRLIGPSLAAGASIKHTIKVVVQQVFIIGSHALRNAKAAYIGTARCIVDAINTVFTRLADVARTIATAIATAIAMWLSAVSVLILHVRKAGATLRAAAFRQAAVFIHKVAAVLDRVAHHIVRSACALRRLAQYLQYVDWSGPTAVCNAGCSLAGAATKEQAVVRYALKFDVGYSLPYAAANQPGAPHSGTTSHAAYSLAAASTNQQLLLQLNPVITGAMFYSGYSLAGASTNQQLLLQFNPVITGAMFYSGYSLAGASTNQQLLLQLLAHRNRASSHAGYSLAGATVNRRLLLQPNELYAGSSSHAGYSLAGAASKQFTGPTKSISSRSLISPQQPLLIRAGGDVTPSALIGSAENGDNLVTDQVPRIGSEDNGVEVVEEMLLQPHIIVERMGALDIRGADVGASAAVADDGNVAAAKVTAAEHICHGEETAVSSVDGGREQQDRLVAEAEAVETATVGPVIREPAAAELGPTEPAVEPVVVEAVAAEPVAVASIESVAVDPAGLEAETVGGPVAAEPEAVAPRVDADKTLRLALQHAEGVWAQIRRKSILHVDYPAVVQGLQEQARCMWSLITKVDTSEAGHLSASQRDMVDRLRELVTALDDWAAGNERRTLVAYYEPCDYNPRDAWWGRPSDSDVFACNTQRVINVCSALSKYVHDVIKQLEGVYRNPLPDTAAVERMGRSLKNSAEVHREQWRGLMRQGEDAMEVMRALQVELQRELKIVSNLPGGEKRDERTRRSGRPRNTREAYEEELQDAVDFLPETLGDLDWILEQLLPKRTPAEVDADMLGPRMRHFLQLADAAWESVLDAPWLHHVSTEEAERIRGQAQFWLDLAEAAFSLEIWPCISGGGHDDIVGLWARAFDIQCWVSGSERRQQLAAWLGPSYSSVNRRTNPLDLEPPYRRHYEDCKRICERVFTHVRQLFDSGKTLTPQQEQHSYSLQLLEARDLLAALIPELGRARLVEVCGGGLNRHKPKLYCCYRRLYVEELTEAFEGLPELLGDVEKEYVRVTKRVSGAPAFSSRLESATQVPSRNWVMFAAVKAGRERRTRITLAQLLAATADANVAAHNGDTAGEAGAAPLQHAVSLEVPELVGARSELSGGDSEMFAEASTSGVSSSEASAGAVGGGTVVAGANGRDAMQGVSDAKGKTKVGGNVSCKLSKEGTDNEQRSRSGGRACQRDGRDCDKS